MARANAISNAALAAKWRGKDRALSDGGSRGAGRLVAIIRQSGTGFYFQYFDSKHARRLLSIDTYGSSGKRGVTLQGARDRAAELSALYRSGVLDLHEHFKHEREAAERARHEADDALRRAERAARSSTLRQLLEAYVGHLERSGKESAGQVRTIFARHVFEAAPELADQRAAEIPVDAFVSLIARLVEAGKGRTAAKLRSYLRAAFALALRAKTDPAAPMILRTFGIEFNPVAAIGALPQFNRARDRVLSGNELGALLRRLDAAKGVEREAVLLALYCGGQRTVQLLRVAPRDVDMDAATLTLLDTKGRRIQPRRHVVPLTRKALEIVERRLATQPDAEAPIFGALRSEMVARLISRISVEMVEANEARVPFDLRDLRRTCETMLAALGVSSDVRAQIQSHGLGGVQARHYDRHSYALEKRTALQKWGRHLDALRHGGAADVLPLARRRSKT